MYQLLNAAPDTYDETRPLPYTAFAEHLKGLVRAADLAVPRTKLPYSLRIGFADHLWGLSDDQTLANRLQHWTGKTMFTHYGSKAPMTIAKRLLRIPGIFDYYY